MTLRARQLRQQVRRHGRGVAEGPVVVPDQPVDEVEGLRLDHELRVLGRRSARPPPARARARRTRVWPAKPIVKVLTRPPAASAMSATTVDESSPPERKAPSGTSATSRRSTAARSSARKRSSASASLIVERVAPGVAPAAREPRSPVAPRRLGPGLRHHHQVARRQRADPAVEGARRRHVAVGQEERQRLGVPLVRHVRVREERLHLRREREDAAARRGRRAASCPRGRARAAAAVAARPRARTRTSRRAPRPRSSPFSS